MQIEQEIIERMGALLVKAELCGIGRLAAKLIWLGSSKNNIFTHEDIQKIINQAMDETIAENKIIPPQNENILQFRSVK